jgi:hypothetical protein
MTQPPAGLPPYGEPQYPQPDPYGYPGYPQPNPWGYSGYPAPPPTKLSEPVTGWAMLLGGVLGAIGSVTPWASVHFLGLNRTINGTDGDGKLSVVCAGVVAVMGLLIVLRVGHLWTSIVGLVFAVFTALIGFADVGSINGNYGPLNDANVPDGAVSTACGVWLVALGGALGVVASIVAMVRRS